MNEPTVYPFPRVLLAEVPCPIPDCEREIEVYAALLVREHGEGDTSLFTFGTHLDTNDLELHMIEHGMTPTEVESE